VFIATKKTTQGACVIDASKSDVIDVSSASDTEQKALRSM